MKYVDFLHNLSFTGYNDPIPSDDPSDIQRARKYRCPKCGSEMQYVITMSAPSNPKVNYRGFLVCRSCKEVVETHGYDW